MRRLTFAREVKQDQRPQRHSRWNSSTAMGALSAIAGALLISSSPANAGDCVTDANVVTCSGEFADLASQLLIAPIGGVDTLIFDSTTELSGDFRLVEFTNNDASNDVDLSFTLQEGATLTNNLPSGQSVYVRNRASSSNSVIIDGTIRSQSLALRVWTDVAEATDTHSVTVSETGRIEANGAQTAIWLRSGGSGSLAEMSVTIDGYVSSNRIRAVHISQNSPENPNIVSINIGETGLVEAGQQALYIGNRGSAAAIFNIDGTVIGGWDPTVVGGVHTSFDGNAAIIAQTESGGSQVNIGSTGHISSLNDLAILDSDGTINANVDASMAIINNGTIVGNVDLGGGDDSFVNNSPNSWNIRNFSATTGPDIRDTENVALNDFGAGDDIFVNNSAGTIRLLTVEDMSGFTADTTDDTAPTAWLTSGIAEYFPDMGDPSQPSVQHSITQAGIEQAHLVGLETFENAGLITLADAETGGVGPISGDIFVITANSIADGSAGTGTYISNGGRLNIDVLLNDGIVDDTDLLVVDGTTTGTGATVISVTSAAPGAAASADLNNDGIWNEGEGIQIVQVLDATRSAADAFTLAGPIIEDGISYDLFHGASGGDWFLSNLIGSTDIGFCNGSFSASGSAIFSDALGCVSDDNLTLEDAVTLDLIEGAGGSDTIAITGSASVTGGIFGGGSGQDASAISDAGDFITIDTDGTIGGVWGGDDSDIADGISGDRISWLSGTIVQGIYGGNGSDHLQISAQEYNGSQILDGGDDLSTSDGMIDILTLSGLDLAAQGANIQNWESIRLENTIFRLSDNALSVGSEVGTGLFLTDGSTLDAGSALILNGNLAIEAASTLQVTGAGQGEYQITGDVQNEGTITSSDGFIGDRVTIGGNYVGNGNLLTDADLGEQLADQLSIQGDVSGGSTQVTINNIGDPNGRLTGPDGGILLVNVAGSSASNAFLIDPDSAIVGAFEYAIDQSADGNFHLVSNYQNGVATIEGYGASLLEMIALPTMQQRVGNRNWTASNQAHRDGTGIWSSIEGTKSKQSPETSTTPSRYQNDIWKARMGLDLALADNDSGTGATLGIFGHYGGGETEISSAITGQSAIDHTVWGGGLSLSVFSDSGLYADTQIQYSNFDSDLAVEQAGASRIGNATADSFGGGVEIGYRIGSSHFAIIPQAQISYATVSYDDFNLGTLEVESGNSKRLRGRIGAAINSQSFTNNGHGSTHISAIINLHKEFEGDNNVIVSGTNIRSTPQDLWGEIGLGVTQNFADGRVSLFGEGSYEAALSNSSGNNSFKARVGLRLALGGSSSMTPLAQPRPSDTPAFTQLATPETPLPSQTSSENRQACESGPYIVFFDWDQSDITQEAKSVLNAAAANFDNCTNVQIMLAGHADRSGTSSYNRDLSQRRNLSVREYLARNGVTAELIVSNPMGEEHMRVPTADGVREPQNRRVEIEYGPGSGQ